jgi:hypothetical protein
MRLLYLSEIYRKCFVIIGFYWVPRYGQTGALASTDLRKNRSERKGFE